MAGKNIFVLKNLTAIEVDDEFYKCNNLKDAVKNGTIRIKSNNTKLYNQNGVLNEDRAITEMLMQAIVYCLNEDY